MAPPIPKRLPHLLTRADLATLLVPTYAAARGVDDEEAHERLGRALAAPGVVELLHGGLAAALEGARGPRTTEDALLDRLSKGVAARKGRVKPAPDTPAVAAVLVRLDVEVGLVADAMRATLETPRGRAILDEGLRALGAHLLKELTR